MSTPLNTTEVPVKAGYRTGLQSAIDGHERILALFNGYPANRMTVPDIKHQLEVEVSRLKDTIKYNEVP